MPAILLSVNTRPQDEAHEKEFVLNLSKFMAVTLSKPERYISVKFDYSPTLSFAGSHNPAFIMHITSLGNINPEANEIYSQKIFAYLKEKLNIPGDRGYITFYDPTNAYLGHEGTTFATIFGK